MQPFSVSKNDPVQSIGYFILHCLLFSCISSMTKYLMISGIAIIQILSFQTFFACLFLMFYERKFFNPMPSKKRLLTYLVRAILWLLATKLFFSSLDQVALPKAIALSFSTPLFTTILAVLILKESINKNYILALFIGFIGILVILRPDFNDFEFESLVILCACVLWSITDIIIKRSSFTERNTSITWFYSFFSFLLLLPFLPFYWKNVNLQQFLFLISIGAMFLLNIITLTYSYQIGNLTTIQPFSFTSLIFVSVLSYFIFNEVVKLTTIVGSLIIIISSSFIAYQEHRNHKRFLTRHIGKEVI